ncbi:MAG TPA: prolyl oligopeptidase family serine peptidase, partial [Verrucomicrobiae bacterium]|nr:prolyl oligopeptidase family serine peptidase [Verrucomicrobiae bacterium]
LYPPITGPGGGALATQGVREARHLVEHMDDGQQHDWGPVEFSISRMRAVLAPGSGARSLFGVRLAAEHPRYALGILDRESGLRIIETQGSLTYCAFATEHPQGVCVAEGMNHAPQLVRVNTATGAIEPIVEITEAQAQISPLRIEARNFTNRHGRPSTGFVVYPRDYVAGQRYPSVLVTHGADADERFVDQEFQWDYPVQVLAERGYVVLALNEPHYTDTPETEAAYDEYRNPRGSVAPSEVQRLIWLHTIHSFEDAVSTLAGEGLVDSTRVGIAGYSAGSQMVNVAMTQSTLFRAASSGDGGFLEPAGYFTLPPNGRRYLGIYGGSPYQAQVAENYQRLSPTFRAHLASGAILQQVAGARLSFIELYAALREAKVPTQLSAYSTAPGAPESHLFHSPRNRELAMEENLDWFDFWLRDVIDPDPSKTAQYMRWTAMRETACADAEAARRFPFCR